MITKKCTCCGKINRLTDLDYIGKQKGKRFDLVLYNCVCGSTIGIRIPEINPQKKK